MILKFEDCFFNSADLPHEEIINSDHIVRIRIYPNKLKFNLVGVFGRVWVHKTKHNMKELERFGVGMKW